MARTRGLDLAASGAEPTRITVEPRNLNASSHTKLGHGRRYGQFLFPFLSLAKAVSQQVSLFVSPCLLKNII